MRLAIIFSAILLVCLSLPAQTPAPKPQLTSTEKLALKTIQTEFAELQKEQAQVVKDLQEFQKEVEATHPGYVFDPTDGTLAVKPEPKKDTLPTEKK